MPRSLDDCLARMDRSAAFRQAGMSDESQNRTPYTQPLTDAIAFFEELGIGCALIRGVAPMFCRRLRRTNDINFT